MNTQILASQAISVSDFKKNPGKSVELADGEAVAILIHNRPNFYAVPAALYEKLISAIEDLEDIKDIRAREHEKRIAVTLDEL